MKKKKAANKLEAAVKQVSTDEMIECMRIVEALGLAQNENIYIVPAGNATFIRAYSVDNTAITFMAISSEEDGSITLLAMENINF